MKIEKQQKLGNVIECQQHKTKRQYKSVQVKGTKIHAARREGEFSIFFLKGDVSILNFLVFEVSAPTVSLA